MMTTESSGATPRNGGPTLREYIESLFKTHLSAHAQHEAAHEREHSFAQKAIDTAAELAKENKKDANEWRSTMDDREKNFANKEEVRFAGTRLDKLEDAEIARVVEEKLAMEQRSELKRQDDRDRQRQQWVTSTIIGVLVFLAAQVARLVFPT